MKRMLPYLAIVGWILLSFGGMALAQGATLPEDSSVLDIFRPLWEAATGGHWWLAASLSLVVGVTLVKKYHPGKLGQWASTDVGGSSLVLIGSFGGALAAALAGSSSMSTGLAFNALKVAIGAAGGYTLLKKLLIDPVLRPLAEKAPAWLKPVLAVVLWAFDKPDPIAEAEKAGADAVKNNPGPGAGGPDGPSGPATDL